ncbi:MAG: YccF domain-containing protein [Myxococcales bacterium]|nr:YccF domain-containing protein [Myxococcales bacterium]
MDLIRFVLNLLWFVFGGFISLFWFLCGLFLAITIVGLPFARSCFVIGAFAIWPFGRVVVDRQVHTGEADLGTGSLGFLGNVLWFLVCGWWLALAHVGAAIANAVTIIGLPWAWQHLKLALLTLAPIGKMVVDADEA